MPINSRFTAVQLPGSGTIYVETTSIDGLQPTPDNQSKTQIEGESVEIGFVDTLSMLRGAVTGIGAALRSALLETKPSEMSVALSFALKGEANPIPVLVNGSGEGSIRVEIKWKLEKADDNAR